MSVEPGVTEATLRMRTPRMGWMGLLVAGLVLLAIRALEWVVFAGFLPDGSWDNGDNGSLFLGCLFVAEALLIRSFGIDLTSESVNVRGLRRRRVPCSQIQAVLCYRHMGADRVALVLESGQRVVLRVPSTYWGSGPATDARYREDFHRLGQWWLAHRGPSWRPVRPEAPVAPTPG
jgi:hypothetical protein